MIIEEITIPPRESYENQPTQIPQMLEKYQALVGALPQSLFLLDENKYIIGIYNVDPVMLSGCTLKDIVGKSLDVFINDPDSPFHEACVYLDLCFDPVFKTEVPRRFEYMIGSYHLEATVTKIQGNRILSQMRDITHIVEKRQEIERKKGNELAVALTAGGLIPWNYDVEAQLFTSTPENSVIQNELTFAEMAEHIMPEYWPLVTEAFDQLISGKKKHCEFTVRVQTQTGEYLWNNVHAVPQAYSPDGRVTIITGSQKDITREYELAREVENNRSKLALAIRSGGLQMLEYDPEADTIEIGNNDQYKKMAYSSEYRETIHPEDLPQFDALINKLINKEAYNFQLDIRIRSNGYYRWQAVNAAIFHIPNAPSRIIGLTKDITEEIESTQELIELRGKAEESSRLKSAFIANMSHEIRTPLNAIVGFSTMLATTDDEADKKAYLEIVEYNNSLLLNLISDALDLSRLELGNTSFSFEKIRIEPFFTQLLAGIHLKLAPKVKLNCVVESNTLEIISDRRSLIQILTNLLTNAAKFTREGEITLGCTSNPKGGVRLFVRDTGCGIPKERQAEIFERFVKLNDYTQGTGLGLSICQTIINMLGGTIGVESESEKGSEFWCVLPHIAEM